MPVYVTCVGHCVRVVTKLLLTETTLAMAAKHHFKDSPGMGMANTYGWTAIPEYLVWNSECRFTKVLELLFKFKVYQLGSNFTS